MTTDSTYQDLTLDFVGDQEILILMPKDPQKSKNIAPGSAIIAKKIINADLQKENLDSLTYAVYYEGNLHNAKNLNLFSEKVKKALERHSQNYPTKAKLLLPKEELLKHFTIAGILNQERLEHQLLTQPPSQNEHIGSFVDLFPETSQVFLNWVETKK